MRGSVGPFEVALLLLIAVLAFLVRLFSVVRYEAIIHEFDPWFNFRATEHLVNEGPLSFHNWFDPLVWYPLGRHVGATVYPGLMWTAAVLTWFSNAVGLPASTRSVCVFLPAVVSGLTSAVTFLLARESWRSSVTVPPPPERGAGKEEASGGRAAAEYRDGNGAGLCAAVLMALSPAHASRSVAGSFDNEAVAIFAMVFAFYTWLRASRSGSLLAAGLSALSYFYMVSTWGGFVFVSNLIPLHALLVIAIGGFSARLYVSYSVWYVLGLLMAMQIRFVGFAAVSLSAEHIGAGFAFAVVQGAMLVRMAPWRQLARLSAALLRARAFAAACVAALSSAVWWIISSEAYRGRGGIAPFAGRLLALVAGDGGAAGSAIVSSVSEHAPTTWANFAQDLHLAAVLYPIGAAACVARPGTGTAFAVLFGAAAVYFAGVMIRLMLVAAPAACVLAGLGASVVLTSAGRSLRGGWNGAGSRPASLAAIVLTLSALAAYVFHGTWVSAELYSSPSIVLSATGPQGEPIIFDDFREGYQWLRFNTAPDAKVMSWWDYGYQIAAMANRTTLVDNNTWNNTHIATVGRAFALPERESAKLMRSLDVDYVLVIFGGHAKYSSDDIAKFLWMVRIAGGVFPDIQEHMYLSEHGVYRVDGGASQTMLDSLMYRLCYYRFNTPDRVRGSEGGKTNFELRELEEAYTSTNMIVRIYRLLPTRALE